MQGVWSGARRRCSSDEFCLPAADVPPRTFAVSIPMAKHSPRAPMMVAVFTPITWPSEVTDLPSRVARVGRASVWITSSIMRLVVGAQRSSQRAHHTRGHGVLEAIWVSNRDGQLSHAQLLRDPQRSCHQVGASLLGIWLHAHHRHGRLRPSSPIVLAGKRRPSAKGRLERALRRVPPCYYW